MMLHGFPFSIIMLAVSAAVLGYATLAFAHVRVSDGDMAELERLRAEGFLPASGHAIADCQHIRARLREIAPAVCLRQEVWLALYFHLLRLARWCRATSVLDRELLRLAAYQAGHYRIALTRMDALRNPGL